MPKLDEVLKRIKSAKKLRVEAGKSRGGFEALRGLGVSNLLDVSSGTLDRQTAIARIRNAPDAEQVSEARADIEGRRRRRQARRASGLLSQSQGGLGDTASSILGG